MTSIRIFDIPDQVKPKVIQTFGSQSSGPVVYKSHAFPNTLQKHQTSTHCKPQNIFHTDKMTVGPESRYESDDVSPAPLAEPLDFPFSGKTAPNRLYAPMRFQLQQNVWLTGS